MESGPEWESSTSFSPSKARAQQAQAKDWASVDAWLSKRYASKRLPPFERNEDTLQALLTLATINDGADEQRGYIDRIEKSALQSLTKSAASNQLDAYKLLREHLDGHIDLDALAQTAVNLDCADTDMSRLSLAIADLTSRLFMVDQQAQRAEAQVIAMKSEHAKVSQLLKELKQYCFQTPADLPDQTAEWMRSTKQLKAKIGEYDERLSTLRSSQAPSPRVEEVVQHMHDLDDLREQLTDLNVELQAFQSLPSDPKAARAKLESARDDLRKHTQKRDQLFEKMVDK